ncbi:hypothetical protein PHET_02556 [Paragonimus heterotremus]|uniref:Uncharacterized protein n=1 Tax=Paragonimus heterotremus TaxID=100268 RepID=A0A8J4SR57_9TREM|nr:hypothetical protein PHET_02556 [Paragonimus heterotremus]
MLDDPQVPPAEPYKACTTIPPGQTQDPPLLPGARRFLTTQPGCNTPGHIIFNSSSPLNRFDCPGIVLIREQPPRQPTTGQIYGASLHKPTAAVVPTTSAGLASAPLITDLAVSQNRYRSNVTDRATQTDDVGIDMDLLLHVEDMLRTQRSLTLPKNPSSVVARPTGCSMTSAVTECTEVPNVKALQEQVVNLKEALGLQSKVNADLKRLLTSALAGNFDLAEKLVDLTSDNVNLSGRSHDLAIQKAALAEVADTAGIAADVWRAKCLAGRVVATEAARRLALANRQAQLARHSLAHLLGERARLRLELGQTAALLCTGTPVAGTTPPVAQDTLGLAVLCHHLTSTSHSTNGTSVSPVLCQSDTPGEHLALRVLTNSFPEEVFTGQMDWRPSVHCSSSELPASLPPIPPTDSNDLIEKALNAFSSTQSLGTDTSYLSVCRGCKGSATII